MTATRRELASALVALPAAVAIPAAAEASADPWETFGRYWAAMLPDKASEVWLVVYTARAYGFTPDDVSGVQYPVNPRFAVPFVLWLGDVTGKEPLDYVTAEGVGHYQPKGGDGARSG